MNLDFLKTKKQKKTGHWIVSECANPESVLAGLAHPV